MPDIIFQPGGRRVTVPAGMDLFTASRKAGFTLDAPCGGRGTCGSCLVQVVSGDYDIVSTGTVPKDIIDEGFVLACKTRIRDTDLVVAVKSCFQEEEGKFTDIKADLALIDPALFPVKESYAPLTVKKQLTVPPPGQEGVAADLDRLMYVMRKECGAKEIRYPLPVLARTADALRADGGNITLTLAENSAVVDVLDIESSSRTAPHLGLAVDVGTTTVALLLVDMASGAILDTACGYNEQVSCGLDVISRINYAQGSGRLKELQERVLDTINTAAQQMLARQNVQAGAVSAAVISGNTTMLHLLLGLKPEYIRLAPYTPTILQLPDLAAADIGLGINPRAVVYLSPCVGSYVGGDITAGVLCTSLAQAGEELKLFIDIGTNGEIVVGNSGFLLTCACSAGPAFEGGGIECGMRAAPGAIENVQVDVQSGAARVETIGNKPARGICGSGMISLVAGLFLTGWITEAGKLNRDKSSPAIVVEGRKAKYLLTPPGADQEKVLWVSEQDIENIIRAKAAIFSACALLLNQVGAGFEDLTTVYVAGGFGRCLDIRNCRVLGLLPDLPEEKFRFIGNSSLAGSYMVLLSGVHRDKQVELMQRMTYIDPGAAAGYMDQYTAALFLPHTELGLFPAVKSLLAARRGF